VSADRIDVRFRDAASAEAAKNTASDVAPEMTWQVLPQDDQTTLLAGTLKPAAVQSIQQEALRQNVVTLSNRVNNLGVAEPVIQQQGNDRIVVQLPGVQDVAKAKTIIGRTATLEFRMVEAHAADPNARDYDPQKIADARNGILPPNTQVLQVKRDRPETLLVARQPIITGENLTSATADQDSEGRGAIVNVVLDSAGASIMKSVTRDSVKRRMAVLLIEKGVVEVLTAPTIQSELGNRFQISGMVNLQEASDLALLMRSGSLAAPMEIIEERTVGPSLGKENIAQGFHSVLWGFAAIAVFMCLYYMLFGVFSSIALAINVLLLIALLSMLQATLTLPGIAAIALALGMAIDSNVLINERIREELRNGSSPQTAISVGYERAWATILDSNVTTLIAGVALLAFGSGPVRGFAVVHCLGILTSMFSAVFFSRGLVN
ncbi:MAG: protein translocase subunit SecD, partial [Aquabacterium sp.]